MSNDAGQPHILRNMLEICYIMGVSRQTVMDWVSMGAPIAVERDGKRRRYSAEAGALQSWRHGMSTAGELMPAAPARPDARQGRS